MAQTTTFYKKDGSISSMRTTIGAGSNRVSLSSYMGSTRGGVTFKSKGFSSRLNSSGQSMGYSMRTGNKTSYHSPTGSVLKKMPGF